jgi:hypothetical protein
VLGSVLHASSLVVFSSDDSSVLGVFLYRVSSDSLLCACINLIIGFRPECVIDSLFK